MHKNKERGLNAIEVNQNAQRTKKKHKLGGLFLEGKLTHLTLLPKSLNVFDSSKTKAHRSIFKIYKLSRPKKTLAENLKETNIEKR